MLKAYYTLGITEITADSKRINLIHPARSPSSPVFPKTGRAALPFRFHKIYSFAVCENTHFVIQSNIAFFEKNNNISKWLIKRINKFPNLPLSDIEIRTMESDIKAIESSGGDLDSIQLFGIPKEEVKIAEFSEEVKIKLGVPGYTGPEQAIFAQKEKLAEKKYQPDFKNIFLIIGITVAVAGIGFLAYYLALNILK